jgi:2-polyprenyl-6-methoxyphenol hydroxylase-like FAD-dependent oxidoreductase
MPNPILKQAIVIGAGMGGLPAAKAVGPHFEKVIVFDCDALPDAPAPRPGTPQARHPHGLLAGGCRALERLFPGIELDFIEAGAVRMRLRRDMRFEVPGFDHLPQRDFGFDSFCLSRPVLERVCRRRVEQEPNIEFRPRTRVTGLIASPDNRAVAGVQFEDARGTPGSLAADLVVYASGRASPTLRLLDAIGSAKPAAIEIGIDQPYATAVFEKSILCCRRRDPKIPAFFSWRRHNAPIVPAIDERESDFC